jgi:hypothetical protein
MQKTTTTTPFTKMWEDEECHRLVHGHKEMTDSEVGENTQNRNWKCAMFSIPQ